jgi:hypothetical protein
MYYVKGRGKLILGGDREIEVESELDLGWGEGDRSRE